VAHDEGTVQFTVKRIFSPQSEWTIRRALCSSPVHPSLWTILNIRSCTGELPVREGIDHDDLAGMLGLERGIQGLMPRRSATHVAP
jgi:hypothetical protein